MRTDAPIVVGTDGSPAAEIAIRWAAEEAFLQGSALRIVLALDVVGEFLPGVDYYPMMTASYEKEARKMMQAGALLARSLAGGSIDVTTELLRGPTISTLVTESKDARMLVLGSRGRGAFSSAILGSVSAALARHAHSPVAVIHESTPSPAGKLNKPVLVGVDGTANSEQAIGVAMHEASIRGVPLRALYAWRDVSGAVAPNLYWESTLGAQRAVLAERMAGWQEQYPDVKIERFVVEDSPVRNLLEHSVGVQLVVVGSRGRGGFTGMLLGSTSQALVHSIKCPLIVVRKD